MSTTKSEKYPCPGLNCEEGPFETAAALARHANNSEECVEWNRFKWFTTGGIRKHQKHCYEKTAPSPPQQRDDSQSQTGQAIEPRGEVRQRDAAIPGTIGNGGGPKCPQCEDTLVDPAALGRHLNRNTNTCTITSAADREKVEALGLQQCSEGDCTWWGKHLNRHKCKATDPSNEPPEAGSGTEGETPTGTDGTEPARTPRQAARPTTTGRGNAAAAGGTTGKGAEPLEPATSSMPLGRTGSIP